ncbi:hypothetical protein [Clostridium tertium]|uniref:hypothetical protein n=1 Tax=Clostridium tertium TaxID=1559 RepID=UPI0024B35730|nr:hypothetical protein [Clostridium tertium]MDI9218228.1 hypothetical protein [Clostridium tertium]
MKSKNNYNSKKNKDHCSASREGSGFERAYSSESKKSYEVENKRSRINKNKQGIHDRHTIKDRLGNKKIRVKDKDRIAEDIKNDTEAEVKNNNEAENNNSQNNASVPNRDELFSQLGTLNLSIDTLYIIILATLLNLYYLYSLRAGVSDQLFNTNESEKFINTKNFPRITNAMFLYATGIFLDINYRGLEEAKRASKETNDKRAVVRAWKSFLSSLLVFIATTISRDNLEV